MKKAIYKGQMARGTGNPSIAQVKLKLLQNFLEFAAEKGLSPEGGAVKALESLKQMGVGHA